MGDMTLTLFFVLSSKAGQLMDHMQVEMQQDQKPGVAVSPAGHDVRGLHRPELVQSSPSPGLSLWISGNRPQVERSYYNSTFYSVNGKIRQLVDVAKKK